MAENITIDLSQIRNFVSRLSSAAKGDFKKELKLWIEALGVEFLRYCEDEIMRRKVINTRLLLNSFHKGDTENIWEWSDGFMALTVGTNVEYAKHVNDGHWTCKAGEIGRFVPGVWNGDEFVYSPGAKTGMYLKQRFVSGKHYWEAALRYFEKNYPAFFEAALSKWINTYFQ